MSEVQKATLAKTPGPVINKAVKADQKKAKADQDGVGKKPDQKVAEKAAEVQAEPKAEKKAFVPGQYPWRENTLFRAVFMKALEGATEDQLKKFVEDTAQDGNFAFQKKILLRGYSRIDRNGYGHTWKLNRDDGKLQPYDIKVVKEFRGKK